MRKSNRLWILSGVLFMLLLVIFISPYIFVHGNKTNLEQQLQSPSIQHIFGTDNFGRDMFQRTFNGLRVSLILALIIEIISVSVGILVGLVTGFFGGIVDEFFVHIMNVFMCFPSIFVALCVVSIMGANLFTLVLALAILGWVTFARLVRSEVLALKERDFILGVRAAGGSNFYIIFKHILPNIIMPLVPLFTLMIGHTTIGIAGLSFLGFGAQPPTAEIGLMLKESMSYIGSAPWLMIFPGLVLATCVLLFNMLGDELRDLFDPQNDGNMSKI